MSKRRTYEAVAAALGRGTLKRHSCEICGNHKAIAHHEDYAKPLRVIWLCGTHHGLLHADRYSFVRFFHPVESHRLGLTVKNARAGSPALDLKGNSAYRKRQKHNPRGNNGN